jgi:hypothetical protein
MDAAATEVARLRDAARQAKKAFEDGFAAFLRERQGRGVMALARALGEDHAATGRRARRLGIPPAEQWAAQAERQRKPRASGGASCAA